MPAHTTLDHLTITILENFFRDMIIYDHAGTLIYACDKFWTDTKLDREEWIGKHLSDIIDLGVFIPTVAEIAYRNDRKATIVQEAFGREITVATAAPIKNQKGETLFIISYAEDNAEIVDLEEKLLQAAALLEKQNLEIYSLRRKQLKLLDPVGQGERIEQVRQTISRVQDFDANILLTGETGTGKSMYANLIHCSSNRKNLPFIEINCAAIPPTLLESELFGYEHGACTGADARGKKGYIELAAGGTLFLDEISELPLSLQSKLLKVIQDKKVTPVGGTKAVQVDFRLITASNKDLEDMTRDRTFRADLYYRLNVIPIHIPALRERREDIRPLSSHFLHKYNAKYNERKTLHPRALDIFARHDWPGNVRELENTVERLILTVEHSEITPADLPAHLKSGVRAGAGPADGLRGILASTEKNILLEAREAVGDNISAIARKLKISRQAVLRKLEKHGIAAE
jgi:transcriptional regulator with PAS, ATPase and Fis domain